MVILEDEEDLVSEDPSKQGRMTETEYEEVDAAKILADASRERVKTYKSYTRRRRSTVSSRDSTAGAREDQERIDFEKALELQKQLDERQDTDDIDWNAIAEQNMAGYKMNYFKGMSYDEIRPIFEEEYNKIQTLFKKDTEVEKTMTKRVAEETLLQESFKRLRAAEALRVGDHIEAYHTFAEMLKKFDKDDLEKLWKLVKERFNTIVPTNDKEKELWVKLKRLFEPDDDNEMLWKLQRIHASIH
ncbi:hypothetical protein Tco_1373392 [Tanacetum coccineum]